MAVGAVRRLSVVGTSADGDSLRYRGVRVEPGKHQIGSASGSLRVENRVAARLIHRGDVQAGANLTDSARLAAANVQLLHLSSGVAEHCEHDGLAARRPRW